MKFKYRRQVRIGFRSGTGITVYCDQIIYKRNFFERLVFLYAGIEVCDCMFNEVSSIEYYESLFAADTTYIDKYDVIGGDLVDCI